MTAEKMGKPEATPSQGNIIKVALVGFSTLFFRRRFVVHRLFGLAYLMEYVYCCYLYLKSYPEFLDSWVIITLPITGIVQSVSAMYYFRFLPKRTTDPGYYNDKTTMSYNFVCENLFFALLLAFQFLYYNPKLTEWIRYFWVIESLFVFLPYTWRTLFPKTRFRDSLKKQGTNTSKGTETYYFYATWMTKIFYLWAKFYIGFFLNYLMFIDAVDEHIRFCVYTILVPSAMATTISMFLHTLRFKRYLYGTTSFTIYVVSYLATFYGWSLIAHVFFEFKLLSFVCFVGAVINVKNLNAWHAYQALVMALGYSGLLRAEAWEGSAFEKAITDVTGYLY